jgi:hypothetical protein
MSGGVTGNASSREDALSQSEINNRDFQDRFNHYCSTNTGVLAPVPVRCGFTRRIIQPSISTDTPRWRSRTSTKNRVCLPRCTILPSRPDRGPATILRSQKHAGLHHPVDTRQVGAKLNRIDDRDGLGHLIGFQGSQTSLGVAAEKDVAGK